MGLASYLFSKFQPLVRIQQAKQKKIEDGGGGNTVSMIDAQLGYYLDGYGTRMAVGFAHSSDGADQNTQYSNVVFAGIQLQK